MANEYLSSKETRQLLGVTLDTLRSWDKAGRINTIRTPSGFRMYSKKDVYGILGIRISSEEKRKIAYCRVSSKKQEGDLERQKDFFRSNYPDFEVVADVGSGINWKRKGFKEILEQAMQGRIDTVVVAHRDRLCRFAFELVENIFATCKTKLIVLDREDHKPRSEGLADDILSIVHVYSCREMGRRRYKNQKDKIVPEQDTEKDSDTVERNGEVCEE